ncbi:ABC transporter ATP-binding protein [Haladaptatus halobius]|uniref:ABC transporter ATP-binding protein n=1 Tax=Haladaptatus halobius TaxID=2884875 RepID=UPI001D0A0D58|nr:sn-glycerol-3-phosphate ABC transporter ATP-binding protein UgpC [Haladaptatus halobius]
MAALTLKDITKVFREAAGTEVVAVDDASIEIKDGEFIVLVGPSGCGKSTTLRMIAGLETLTDGEIILDDEVINGKQSRERDIAMVFQSFALYPHMTVRGNMSFGLEESTDMYKGEIQEQVESTAEMMGIADLLDRKPSELSGGQQQRVALGRAIVRDPKVFLMDEPLSNLDAKLRSQMRTELQRLQENLGVTTVYVTHDQTEAMTMGDRVVVLNDGRIQQVGTPLECYHEPANEFVAGFIGEPPMNFFEMEVQEGSLVNDDFEYPLSTDTCDAIGDVSRVRLGIRPEDIQLADTVESDHDFHTTVDVVEPVGSENNVYLAFDRPTSEISDDSAGEVQKSLNVDIDEGRTFVATISGLRDIDAGQSIIAHIPENAIHIFEAKSGNALRNRVLEDIETADSIV